MCRIPIDKNLISEQDYNGVRPKVVAPDVKFGGMTPNNAINADKQKDDIDNIFGGPEPPAPIVSAPDNAQQASAPSSNGAMVSPRQNVQSLAPPAPGRGMADDDAVVPENDSRRS